MEVIARRKSLKSLYFQYRSWGWVNGVWTPDAWQHNLVPNEGETFWLDVLTGRTNPATIYMGLAGDVSSPYADPLTPAEADTLTTWAAAEMAVSNGYARAAVSRNTTDFPNAPVAGAPSTVLAARKTFTATGGPWGTVYRPFLCSVASGTAGVGLSIAGTAINGGAGRLISSNGDALGIDYTLTLD